MVTAKIATTIRFTDEDLVLIETIQRLNGFDSMTQAVRFALRSAVPVAQRLSSKKKPKK